MKPSSKLVTAALLISLFAAAFGQVFLVHSETSPLQSKALPYIQTVLPIDTSRYTISFQREYALPQGPSDHTLTESVSYNLNANTNGIHAHFTFRNGLLHECALTVTSGAVIPARNFSNLADVAVDVLTRYQALTGIDSSVLITLLGSVDETGYSSAFAENINLTVSKTSFPNQVDLSSGHIVPVGNDTTNTTTFHWTYLVGGAAYLHTLMTFTNGVFSRFTDDRAVYTIGSTDVSVTSDEAIRIALDYLGSHTFLLHNGTQIAFNMSNADPKATLASYLRNGSVLYPFWGVLVDFDGQVTDDVSIYVWADSGGIFWSYLAGQQLTPTDLNSQATPSAEPPETAQLTTTPITTPSSSSPTPDSALPEANANSLYAAEPQPTQPPRSTQPLAEDPADANPNPSARLETVAIVVLSLAVAAALAVLCLLLVKRRR